MSSTTSLTNSNNTEKRTIYIYFCDIYGRSLCSKYPSQPYGKQARKYGELILVNSTTIAICVNEDYRQFDSYFYSSDFMNHVVEFLDKFYGIEKFVITIPDKNTQFIYMLDTKTYYSHIIKFIEILNNFAKTRIQNILIE